MSLARPQRETRLGPVRCAEERQAGGRLAADRQDGEEGQRTVITTESDTASQE